MEQCGAVQRATVRPNHYNPARAVLVLLRSSMTSLTVADSTTTAANLRPAIPITDWQERLAIVCETMKEMSLQTDPQELVRTFGRRMASVFPLTAGFHSAGGDSTSRGIGSPGSAAGKKKSTRGSPRRSCRSCTAGFSATCSTGKSRRSSTTCGSPQTTRPRRTWKGSGR